MDSGTLCIEFELFLLLYLRASGTIKRYENEAEHILTLQGPLRALGAKVCTVMEGDLFHEKSKERIIAQLLQVPLCFREMLLEIERMMCRQDFLLSYDDRIYFKYHEMPLEKLLRTVQVRLGEGCSHFI